MINKKEEKGIPGKYASQHRYKPKNLMCFSQNFEKVSTVADKAHGMKLWQIKLEILRPN